MKPAKDLSGCIGPTLTDKDPLHKLWIYTDSETDVPLSYAYG
jgi:hypothetical protein